MSTAKRSASASPGHKPPSKVPRTDDPIDKALREDTTVIEALEFLQGSATTDALSEALCFSIVKKVIQADPALDSNTPVNSLDTLLHDPAVREALKKNPASFDPIRQHVALRRDTVPEASEEHKGLRTASKKATKVELNM